MAQQPYGTRDESSFPEEPTRRFRVTFDEGSNRPVIRPWDDDEVEPTLVRPTAKPASKPVTKPSREPARKLARPRRDRDRRSTPPSPPPAAAAARPGVIPSAPARRRVLAFTALSGGFTCAVVLGLSLLARHRPPLPPTPPPAAEILSAAPAEPAYEPFPYPPPSNVPLVDEARFVGPIAPPEVMEELRIAAELLAEERRKLEEAKWAARPRVLPTVRVVAADEAHPEAFVWPVPSNVITSRFGKRKDPLDPETLAVHRGVDVRCPLETPVLVAAPGEVVVVRKSPRGGVSIRVKHDENVSTLYAHLAKAEVKKGDLVQAGQIIGRSGSSGRSTGPHLHLEVWRGRRALDPARLAWRELGPTHIPLAPYPATPQEFVEPAPSPMAPVPPSGDPRLSGALAERSHDPLPAPSGGGSGRVQPRPPAQAK